MKSPARYPHRSYIAGFILSVVLTYVAYWLAQEHVHSEHSLFDHSSLVIMLSVLALAQMIIQLTAFMHLSNDRRPYWSVGAFLYAALLVFFLVGGSMWVMYHLNTNMGYMTPEQTDAYMIERQ